MLPLGIVTVKVEVVVDRSALRWALAAFFSATTAITAGALAGFLI